MLFWNANPILVQLGPIAVHWYGALFAAGFLLGYQLMQRIYRQEGRPTEQLDKLLTYIFIGTVVGARLAHTLIYEPEYYLAHPIDILKIWEGGLASHGGGIGVLLAIWLFVRQHPENRFLWLADRLAIPTALTGCFIRLGIVVSQAQFGTNQLFVTVHRRFRFRPLVISGLFFPFAQFTGFKCFNGFVSWMPFFP
jgi:prolipoprotein diacylglyceryl transferase